MNLTHELRANTMALVCIKCTREEFFGATTQPEAIEAAIERGWARKDGRMICPKCPK